MRTALLIIAAVFALVAAILAAQPLFVSGWRFATEWLVLAAIATVIALGLTIIAVLI